MKKLIVLLFALVMVSGAMAQDKPAKNMPEPFNGGVEAMQKFFKDSTQIGTDIIRAKATGIVIFKFTTDSKGIVSRIVVDYADDLMLTQPLIDALKKSNGKWVAPYPYKVYDFVIAFSINLIPSDSNLLATQRDMYNYYQNRKPVLANNQVPTNAATLLPTVVINYAL